MVYKSDVVLCRTQVYLTQYEREGLAQLMKTTGMKLVYTGDQARLKRTADICESMRHVQNTSNCTSPDTILALYNNPALRAKLAEQAARDIPVYNWSAIADQFNAFFASVTPASATCHDWPAPA